MPKPWTPDKLANFERHTREQIDANASEIPPWAARAWPGLHWCNEWGGLLVHAQASEWLETTGEGRACLCGFEWPVAATDAQSLVNVLAAAMVASDCVLALARHTDDAGVQLETAALTLLLADTVAGPLAALARADESVREQLQELRDRARQIAGERTA